MVTIDAYFVYKLGTLESRSVRFWNEILDKPNFQDNAAVNYAGGEPRGQESLNTNSLNSAKMKMEMTCPKSLFQENIPRRENSETSRTCPVNDKKNALYEQYKALVEAENKVIFGGRFNDDQTWRFL